MSRPKISILHLVAAIVVVAIWLAAIRIATPAWAGAMSSFAFFAMISSFLGVAWGRGTRRVFWSGFAALGWGYFLLGYVPWNFRTVGHSLLAPNLFEQLFTNLHPPQMPGGLQSVPPGILGASATGGGFGGGQAAAPGGPDHAAFIRIGLSMEMLLWALLGGWTARYFASGRDREAAPANAPGTGP
jgi:hypothetical protein